MVTPLKKHRGQHGGLIALLVLAATVTVVVVTQPHKPAPVAPLAPRPQASAISTTPKPPERPPLPPIALTDRIKTAVVAERELPRQITVTGETSYNGSLTAHVGVPVAGWLQKARPVSLGRRIRAGETLAVIYSPEVYLTTATVIAQIRDYRSPEELDAARVRLLRWGMRKEQLIEIESSGRPQGALPLIARVSGIVVAEPALPGPLVEPNAGTELFTITDPTYGALYVDIAAADAARAQLGMAARVTVDGIAQPVTAPIGYISRRVEDGKRTVRFDLHDRALAFKAGAAAKVVLVLPAERRVAVPAAAVVRDDGRTIVYVARGKLAEAREVTLAETPAPFYLVDAGLAAGETVVLDPRR